MDGLVPGEIHDDHVVGLVRRTDGRGAALTEAGHVAAASPVRVRLHGSLVYRGGEAGYLVIL